LKFRLTVNGSQLLLDIHQLESVIDILATTEQLTESHVGANQGSQGYQSAFVPVIKPVVTHEIFTVAPVNQDYIDTIKLSMKLDNKLITL
jgi:aerobic-type carbon monoxide dehydrogenase small subunit (CoxS/CutS family)